MAQLNRQVDGINEKIDERQLMLDETNNILTQAREKLATIQREHTRLQESVGDDLDREINEAHNNILTDQQQSILEQSGYNDLTSEPMMSSTVPSSP